MANVKLRLTVKTQLKAPQGFFRPWKKDYEKFKPVEAAVFEKEVSLPVGPQCGLRVHVDGFDFIVNGRATLSSKEIEYTGTSVHWITNQYEQPIQRGLRETLSDLKVLGWREI